MSLQKSVGVGLLNFKDVLPAHRNEYNFHLFKLGVRGAEASFGNIFLWGKQKIDITENGVYILSTFGNHTFYSFPVGEGDTAEYVRTMILDSEERGIPCIINGITRERMLEMKALFPSRFEFSERQSFFDYVYKIEDLANLEGKKYSKKRNHLNRFNDACPNYKVCGINSNNIDRVRKMADEWYASRLQTSPDTDFSMERCALFKALDNYDALGLEGIFIESEGKVIAFTIGNRLLNDTFDIEFEKATDKIQGAYVAINNEFARYLSKKYPELKYLNREEDMGIEGLRKAKNSYFPVFLVEKYRATLINR